MSEAKVNLFSLVAQANQISQTLAESGGELTPELEALMAHVDVKLPEKVDGYHVVMERLEVEAGYWKAQADLYARIAKAHLAMQSRIKETLKKAMLELGTNELLGNDIRFKLSNTQPALEVEEQLLDRAYLMEIKTLAPDKERIKAQLLSGNEVVGAKLRPSYSLRPYPNKKGGAK